MRILLTGSGGQLGCDLAPLLEMAGHDVIAPRSKELDIADNAKVSALVSSLRPDIIINAAAYTKVDMAETEREAAAAVNGRGPENLACAAELHGAALVHISTDFVFDGKKPRPYTEDDATNPLGVYGRTKLDGEERIRQTLERHMIVRTSWLYGSGGSGGNFVKTILRLASEREHLRVVYDQAGSPTWTTDLAVAISGIVRSIEESDGREDRWGLYHYSNEGVASWYDFAVAIVEEAQRAGFPIKCNRVEPILACQWPTPAERPAYSVLDKAKIKAAFSMTIPHWRSGLRAMLTELYGGGYA